MMAPSARYFSRLDLACEASAVHYARGHAEGVLRSWGLPEDLTFDALTIVAEPASNAVRHAGVETQPFDPGRGQPHVPTCTPVLWISGGHLCISMADESSAPPILRPPSASSETGRGLQLIAGLSEGAWGFQLSHARPGKFVWAWLRLPARPPQARTAESMESVGNVAPSTAATTVTPEALAAAMSA